jgi:hypothetical protein
LSNYQTIEAAGQTLFVEDFDYSMENVLLDMTTGEDLTVAAGADDWEIRNVGVKGENTSGEGTVQFAFSVTDSDGTGIVEDVYAGDGATRGGDQDHGHGANGFWLDNDPEHKGELIVRNCHVAGWSDNGMYMSTVGPGSVTIDNCISYNNYVSEFRINCNGAIKNSAAFNDDDGYNGRPVWIWPYGSEAEIFNLDLDQGDYPYAIDLGREGDTTNVYAENLRYDGDFRQKGNVQINGDLDSQGTPDLTMPDRVPTSAVEAAEGSSGDSGSSLPHRFRIEGDGDSQAGVTFEVVVSGDATEMTTNEPRRQGNHGVQPRNGRTLYREDVWSGAEELAFDGEVVSFQADGSGEYTVYVNGEQVNDPVGLPQDLEARIEELEAENTELRGQVSSYEQEIADLKVEVQELETRIVDAVNTLK